ncbi:MAG: hypothetical protein F7O42_10575 [Opitutae bacterium]|nr:hypothetical protein [Opitutae bacterium]
MGRRHSMIRNGVSLLLLTELFLTQLAISSPQLHHWLHGVGPAAHSEMGGCESHEDSDASQQAEHVCAIALVATGILIEKGALELGPSNELREPLPPVAPKLARESAMARHFARGPPHLFS